MVPGKNRDSMLRGGWMSGAAVGLLFTLGLAPLSAAAQSLPTGGTVTHGDAAITVAGPNLTVTQTSPNAILSWQSFSVGGDLTLKGDSKAAVVNRGFVTSLSGDVVLTARRVENSGTIEAPTLLAVDDEITVAATFKRCVQLCFADTDLDEVTIAALRARTEPARLLFADGNQRIVERPVSVSGLSAALDAGLNAMEAK